MSPRDCPAGRRVRTDATAPFHYVSPYLEPALAEDDAARHTPKPRGLFYRAMCGVLGVAAVLMIVLILDAAGFGPQADQAAKAHAATD